MGAPAIPVMSVHGTWGQSRRDHLQRGCVGYGAFRSYHPIRNSFIDEFGYYAVEDRMRLRTGESVLDVSKRQRPLSEHPQSRLHWTINAANSIRPWKAPRVSRSGLQR